ncbi:hypothetical protein BVI1335_1650026 [Burkholderia vietnamiensis]|nr:hypothetical protein BVI1335_1650026 [Burkholderia vietnamiensis]
MVLKLQFCYFFDDFLAIFIGLRQAGEPKHDIVAATNEPLERQYAGDLSLHSRNATDLQQNYLLLTDLQRMTQPVSLRRIKTETIDLSTVRDRLDPTRATEPHSVVIAGGIGHGYNRRRRKTQQILRSTQRGIRIVVVRRRVQHAHYRNGSTGQTRHRPGVRGRDH